MEYLLQNIFKASAPIWSRPQGGNNQLFTRGGPEQRNWARRGRDPRRFLGDAKGMERFEFRDDKSNKFWEITVEGDSYTVRYGRLGTDGQTKTKAFASAEVARREADKMIASKTKKGYAKVSSGGANAAPAAESGSNPELEAAITADPDDASAWQVYADWLQEQGDPRGEAIAFELAGNSEEVAQLISANLDVFLGPLAAHQKTYDGEDTNVFGWKRGFIDSLRLSHDSYGDEDFEGKLVDILRDVLAHPSGRFVSSITFVFNGDPNEDNLQDLIDFLAASAPPTLRKLHFGDFEYCGPSDETATGNTEISWYGIGDLSKLWKAVPNLRKLITQSGSDESAISGTALALGKIDLPSLQHAEFRTGGLAAENARAIANAKIPNIERLDIWYGVDSYGGDATVDDAAPLLARTDLPKLKHLGLKNAVFTDELIAMLVDSPLIKQLETLDISMGCLSDAGATLIADNAPAFAHLNLLDVDENQLSDAGLAILRGAMSSVSSDEQREVDDPEYRYTAVGE